MFFMQSASFLAYQRTMEKGHGRSNCQTLFGIGRIPSDNYIRDFLDEADPALLQPCFERMEALHHLGVGLRSEHAKAWLKTSVPRQAITRRALFDSR